MTGNTGPDRRAAVPTEITLDQLPKTYRYDPLRDLAMLSLGGCMDSAPAGPYAAYMSPDDALDVIFGAHGAASNDVLKEDS